jgi:hypothetical protein
LVDDTSLILIDAGVNPATQFLDCEGVVGLGVEDGADGSLDRSSSFAHKR